MKRWGTVTLILFAFVVGFVSTYSCGGGSSAVAGGDADTLDGYDSSAFALSNHTHLGKGVLVFDRHDIENHHGWNSNSFLDPDSAQVAIFPAPSNLAVGSTVDVSIYFVKNSSPTESGGIAMFIFPDGLDLGGNLPDESSLIEPTDANKALYAVQINIPSGISENRLYSTSHSFTYDGSDLVVLWLGRDYLTGFDNTYAALIGLKYLKVEYSIIK